VKEFCSRRDLQVDFCPFDRFVLIPVRHSRLAADPPDKTIIQISRRTWLGPRTFAVEETVLRCQAIQKNVVNTRSDVANSQTPSRTIEDARHSLSLRSLGSVSLWKWKMLRRFWTRLETCPMRNRVGQGIRNAVARPEWAARLKPNGKETLDDQDPFISGG